MKNRLSAVFLFIALTALAGCSDRIISFFINAKVKLELIDNAALKNKPHTITLPSGEWYAVVLEHSCCSGAGFDAVLVMDSQKQFYGSLNNYCGIEGFTSTLESQHIQNLAGLRSYLLSHRYKKCDPKEIIDPAHLPRGSK